MNITNNFLGLAAASLALAGMANLAACTTDKDDPGASTGGNSGTTGGASGTTGGSSPGGGTGGSGPAGSACASPTVLSTATPGIADFDAYDGIAELGKWSFPLGGDTAVGVFAGPFGYGDRDNGFPETFEMAAGSDSTYSLRIADTLAEKYGGGQGIWISACLNASKFSGISFWTKGSTPDGKSTLTLTMGDTLPTVPAKATDKIGTCTGDAMTCVHPTFVFPVTDTWTEIKIPWASFTAGNAAGVLVKPDGKNIVQVQFGVGLVWVPDTTGMYMPTPAPYDLAVDTLAFY